MHIVGHKPFQCTECNRSFTSGSVLKAHIKTHAGSKNFQCTKCSAAFTTNGSLQRHLLAHEAGHQCPLCPESFRTLQLVERHIKVQHSQCGSEGSAGSSYAASSQFDTVSVMYEFAVTILVLVLVTYPTYHHVCSNMFQLQTCGIYVDLSLLYQSLLMQCFNFYCLLPGHFFTSVVHVLLMWKFSLH